MSLPYEKSNIPVVVAGPGDIHAFDVPNRVELEKLIVVGSGAFNIDVWNRAFATTAINIVAIEDDGNGFCRITLEGKLEVKEGDPVLVAGTDVAGYNTTHRVTSIAKHVRTADDNLGVPGTYRIVTDQSYTNNSFNGTAALNIVGSEQELYRVVATTAASSGAVSILDTDGIHYECQDPKKHDGSTSQRKFYIQFSAAGSYRVTLGFSSHESFAM